MILFFTWETFVLEVLWNGLKYLTNYSKLLAKPEL